MQKFAMNSRVMINAISFKENNLNYFFSNINEKLFKNNDNFNLRKWSSKILKSHKNYKNYKDFEDISFENDHMITKEKDFCFLEELILYNEIIYKFCFLIKW